MMATAPTAPTAPRPRLGVVPLTAPCALPPRGGRGRGRSEGVIRKEEAGRGLWPSISPWLCFP